MLFVFGSAFILSCRDDFEPDRSNGGLVFSRDTVYLDTVFSNIGSATFTLKVFNPNSTDIVIPSVKLAQGETSAYRLNVDGVAGKVFDNVEILARDSIFVFIETTFDISDAPVSDTQFLLTDQIVFDEGAFEQKVELVTLIQDAVFLFPSRDDNGVVETLLLGEDEDGNEIRVEGFFLEDDELTFTNEKPYVIFGFAAIPPDKTLQIQPGARIHFHSESGLIAANNSTLKALGLPSTTEDLENEIIIEGDRLEPNFSNIPGQWGFIWLTDGSKEHEIEHTTIKNATVGIIMDNREQGATAPTLQLENVQIYNNSVAGLLTRNGYISGKNVVINTAGQSAFVAQLGGDYEFTHCTFTNYWVNSFRNTPAVLISNALATSPTDVLVNDLTQANFTNCIIYGNQRVELGLQNVSGAAFNFNFSHSLIRFNPFGTVTDPEFDFNNALLYTNIVLNQDPDFLNTALHRLNIGEDSGANAIGSAQGSALVPVDLVGTVRNTPSDAGAYESIIFE